MQYVQGYGKNQSQEMTYQNSRVDALIDEWIHSARDREMLKARMIDGLTYERLAEEFGMSVSQVRRIMKKGIDIICKHLD